MASYPTPKADQDRILQGLRRTPDAPAPNPKEFFGIKKAPMSVVPTPPLMWAALALLSGALIYGRHNWRKGAPLKASTYRDSTQRHMDAWWEGHDIDKKSKLPALAHAIAGLLVLFDAILRGNFEDDRPPRSDDDWQQKLDSATEAIIDNVPFPHPPVTEKDNG